MECKESDGGIASLHTFAECFLKVFLIVQQFLYVGIIYSPVAVEEPAADGLS